MTKKYFFFDYDGTLAIPRTREILPSTYQTLKELHEKGHFIALATGRLQANALDYMKEVGIRNIVADGGYSVTLDGDLKWMIPLDLEDMKACLRRLDANSIPWAITVANELERITSCEDFDEIAGDYYLPTRYVPDLDIDKLTSIYKIYLPCKLDAQSALLATGALDGVPWVRYNPDTVFVEPMDKQIGIKKMMDYLGAPYKDVVVFGDGKNDISMFIDEWTSIAMGNACEALKEKACFITDSCEKDGIYNACKHFGWL